MKSTAIANANIALVKYWGKRDEKLNLPMNNSISMTLDNLCTTTTVKFNEKLRADEVVLNDEKLRKSEELERIVRHLNLMRHLAGKKIHAKVESRNNFPTAAGLASSASGFAALTKAAASALGLNLGFRELSIIARQGSGSACRSIQGGFVEWEKGKRADGSDSFGKQIADEKYWKKLRMVIAVTQTKEKKVKSRAGMRQTMMTSPFYSGWLKTVEADLGSVKRGILERNFSSVGKTTEHNCLKMHALMLSTKPAIVYWNSATVNAIHAVEELRGNGVEAYFTIDGGPQVKVLCLEKNENKVKKWMKDVSGIKKVIVSRPGKGAMLSNRHLF